MSALVVAAAAFSLGAIQLAGVTQNALELEATVWGGPMPAGGWSLQLASDGHGVLTLSPSVVSGSPAQRRAISISTDAMAALRNEVRASGIIALPSDEREHMGEDFQVCELEVRLGGKQRRWFLASPDDDPVTAERRDPVRRILQVWTAVKAAAQITTLYDPCSVLSVESR
jgi:hypothetical protein